LGATRVEEKMKKSGVGDGCYGYYREAPEATRGKTNEDVCNENHPSYK